MSDKLPQAGAASSTSAASQVPAGSIRVIGAGLGRTGTTSLQAGLKKLGFKPYHMRDVTSSDGHLKLWTQYMLAWKVAAAAGPIGGPLQEAREADKTTAADAVIDRIVSDGFTATTDYPACLIYERLMARFPNALVLLGIRTTGKAWADSVMNTIGQAGPSLSVTPWTFIPTLREFAPITSWVRALRSVWRFRDAFMQHLSHLSVGRGGSMCVWICCNGCAPAIVTTHVSMWWGCISC